MKSATRRRLRRLPSVFRAFVIKADTIWAISVAMVSTALAVVILRLWEWRSSVPMGTSGDFTLAGMIVKTIQDHGSYLTNPDLGWPLGLQLYDLPIGDDNLNLLLMRVISVFTGNFAATMWWFVLLTFPLVAVSGYVVMRRLGVSHIPAAVVGVLYTFLPYHFRAQVFLLLIGYWILPFALLLAVRVFQGVPLIERRPGRRGLGAWSTRRTWATVATCVAIGSTGLYLAAFAVVAILAAGLAQTWTRSGRRPAATAAVAVVLIAGTIVVNTSPSIVYRFQHGANHEVAVRGEQESEIYGLTLTRMVLPPLTHRFEPARRFAEHYQSTTNLPFAGEQSSYLGVVSVAGLIGLLIYLVAAATRNMASSRRLRYGPLAATVVVLTLFGMVGGLNTVFSYLVLPVLRGTGRVSVAIGFCTLAAVGLALESYRARLRRAALPSAVFVATAVAVTVLGLYDQTGTALNPAYYRVIATEWDATDRFVTRVEASVPTGTAVYVIPEQSFPESPGPGGLLDYDQGVGYLHSKNLKWSYGAVKARQARWLVRMSGFGMPKKLERIAACGFGGVWLDRVGYDKPDVISSQLRSLTGESPLVSEDGRREFFDLARYRDEQARRLSVEERKAICDAVLASGRADLK